MGDLVYVQCTEYQNKNIVCVVAISSHNTPYSNLAHTHTHTRMRTE